MVAPHISLKLRAYQKVVGMWKHLKKIYHQENDDRKFQLNIEIGDYSQGEKSIQEYYYGFMNLWIEYNSLIYASVSDATLLVVQEHETSVLDDTQK